MPHPRAGHTRKRHLCLRPSTLQRRELHKAVRRADALAEPNNMLCERCERRAPAAASHMPRRAPVPPFDNSQHPDFRQYLMIGDSIRCARSLSCAPASRAPGWRL